MYMFTYSFILEVNFLHNRLVQVIPDALNICEVTYLIADICDQSLLRRILAKFNLSLIRFLSNEFSSTCTFSYQR